MRYTAMLVASSLVFAGSASCDELQEGQAYACVIEDPTYQPFGSSMVGNLSSAPKTIKVTLHRCGDQLYCGDPVITHFIEVSMDIYGDRETSIYVGNQSSSQDNVYSFGGLWRGEIQIDGYRLYFAQIAQIRPADGSGMKMSIASYSASCFDLG